MKTFFPQIFQMTLVKLYERTKNRDNLYKAIIETLNQSNFQIANEFYYQDFHLFNNYSLQVSVNLIE